MMTMKRNTRVSGRDFEDGDEDILENDGEDGDDGEYKDATVENNCTYGTY